MGMTKDARAERRERIERLFAERDREGLTLAELSRRSGIPQGTLAGWATRLRRERLRLEGAVAEKPAPFLELIATGSSSDVSSAARYEIVLRGERRVLLERSFEESVLTRLVRALEAC